MKKVFILLGAALLVITGILISLLKNRAALRPAKVIRPAEISSDPTLIGRSVANRLFPDFHAAQNVIWYIDTTEDQLTNLAQVALTHYQNPLKPTLHDLRQDMDSACPENCWYVHQSGVPLPDPISQKMRTEPSVEVFVQYFDRHAQVPETCDNQKLLEPSCINPVSVREVRRKIKTPARHFFMQRYLDSRFYLFIEKPS